MSKIIRPATLSRTLALLPPTIALIVPHADGAAYIKLGDIKGESIDPEHNEWVEFSGFTFGVSKPVTTSVGGLERSKAEASELIVSKALDTASPALFLACAKGEIIDTVILDITDDLTGGIYYKLTFMNVRVARVATNHVEGDGQRPTESISLNYEKIRIEYFSTDTKTGKTTLAGSADFNFPEGK